MSVGSYIRGSEWRQWDLHIHTPASFHWLGERFGADPSSVASKARVDQMIQVHDRMGCQRRRESTYEGCELDPSTGF